MGVNGNDVVRRGQRDQEGLRTSEGRQLFRLGHDGLLTGANLVSSNRLGYCPDAETGLMWANMLRAFQVGKALTSDGGPSSWMRPSRVAWAQVSCPACHLMKASA